MNWISVKEKMPEKDGVYIIYAENGDFSQLNAAYYDGMFWHLAPHYRNHVTHWMPLPEPPSEQLPPFDSCDVCNKPIELNTGMRIIRHKTCNIEHEKQRQMRELRECNKVNCTTDNLCIDCIEEKGLNHA